MADSRFPLETVERLIRLVEAHRLRELIVEDSGEQLRIRGDRRNRACATDATQPEAPAQVSNTAASDASLEEPPADQKVLVAPMTGVFYRSPGPDQPHFVEVGDEIEVGQTFCIIEAMKVFSEVPSEEAGTVAEIRAEDGQVVRAGEVLMVLV